MKHYKDHLIINTNTGTLECLHCGSKQAVAYPVYLDIFLAMMKVFEKSHKHCKKPITTNEI